MTESWKPSADWKAIEGILLDAVGTLIEPEPAVAEVYLAAAGRQGVSFERVEVRNRFIRAFRNDEADESAGPMITNEPIEKARWRRIVTTVLNELPAPGLAFEELWDHFAEPASWRVFSDVPDALDTFHSLGMPVRIASNFDGRLRKVVDGHPSLAKLRDRLVISSEVGFRKPSLSFYRAACQQLGLLQQQVLSIGDDLENDVAGPKRAGLHGALLDRRAKAEPGPFCFRSLTELAAALTGR